MEQTPQHPPPPKPPPSCLLPATASSCPTRVSRRPAPPTRPCSGPPRGAARTSPDAECGCAPSDLRTGFGDRRHFPVHTEARRCLPGASEAPSVPSRNASTHVMRSAGLGGAGPRLLQNIPLWSQNSLERFFFPPCNEKRRKRVPLRQDPPGSAHRVAPSAPHSARARSLPREAPSRGVCAPAELAAARARGTAGLAQQAGPARLSAVSGAWGSAEPTRGTVRAAVGGGCRDPGPQPYARHQVLTRCH